MEQSVDSLINRIKVLEDKLEKGIVVKSDNKNTKQTETESHVELEKKQEILPEALPEDLKKVAGIWRNIIAQVTKKAPAIGPALNNATLSVDDNMGLMIVVENDFDKEHVDSEKNKKVINDTISHMLQKSVQINVRSIDKNKENMKDVFDLTKIVKVPIQYE